MTSCGIAARAIDENIDRANHRFYLVDEPYDRLLGRNTKRSQQWRVFTDAFATQRFQALFRSAANRQSDAMRGQKPRKTPPDSASGAGYYHDAIAQLLQESCLQ